MNEKNVWLLRAKPNGVDRLEEFIEESIISVGRPNMGDLTGKCKEELKEILINKFSNNGDNLSTFLSIINTFINIMKNGDFVVVPGGQIVYICEIVTDYIFDESKDNNTDGYPHQRKIKILKSFERNEASEELKKSIRSIRTMINMTKHIDEVTNIAYF